jgi:hypothetical protein
MNGEKVVFLEKNSGKPSPEPCGHYACKPQLYQLSGLIFLNALPHEENFESKNKHNKDMIKINRKMFFSYFLLEF